MSTKDQLLEILKENSQMWVSGETVSSELGVSRAAISKHIAALKKSGYDIESVKGKGYLLKESDLLLPIEIKEELKTETLGCEVVFFEETDSTNIRAREFAEGGAPEGTIVIAENQSDGKGRKGRIWHSDKGKGIFVSIILRPELAPSDVAITTLMTAVAVNKAIYDITGLDSKIKWPNDLLIKGKKVCGILTELATETDRVDYIVVGTGINVNSEISSFPEEIKDIATSLFVESGIRFLRKKILKRFLEIFEIYYNLLKERDTATILKHWKENSETINRKVEIVLVNRTIRGVVEDIDENGVLVVKKDDGESEKIISGDVLFL